ncbi:MAG: sporulation initiation factor Spo0A C-terminal domain-containing protein, partial [Lachnospiraceae bacterium]
MEKETESKMNIILIEDDPVTCQNFMKYIETIDDMALIEITNNSYRALELVKECLPDAVILDLELNNGEGNGLLFLQELKQSSISPLPYILVTTNISSSTTYDYAHKFGADFIMSKHQENYSEKNAVNLLLMMKDIIQSRRKNITANKSDRPVPSSRERQWQRMIARELDFIGISPKAVGYRYLSDAILLIIQGETNNISGALGEKYQKTNSSVERAMQNAINKAWRGNDIDELLLHYKARISSEKGVPTLTEFIHYYANKI